MRLVLAMVLLLVAVHSRAQYAPVTNFSGTATYGSRSVTVTTSGTTSSYPDACLGSTLAYWAGSTGAGSYNYTLSAPIYSILIEASALNAGPLGGGEYLQVTVNGSPYILQPANVLSYAHCQAPGSGPCYLSGGKFFGPVGTTSPTDYSGGILQISICTGITSFSIGCNGTTNGATYHVSIDTTSRCNVIASSNDPVCAGDTIKLFAIGDETAPYAWYGPDGFTSTQENPHISPATSATGGSYFVVQVLGGIPDTAWVSVNVKPRPTAILSSNGPICEGQNLELGATPYTLDETFSWTGPAGFASLTRNPTRNGLTVAGSGLYQLITSLNGCNDTSTLSVTVKPKPNIAASSSGPVCKFESLSLFSGPDLSGGTFDWSGPGGFTSTLQNPVISWALPSGTGVYTVVATLGDCKDTATVYAIISADLDATASASLPVCEGKNLQLSSAPFTGIETYSWSGPAGFTSTQQNPLINGVALSGTGVYTLVASNGCLSTVTVNVIVTPNPEIKGSVDSLVCPGSPAQLFANSQSPGVTFSWIGPNHFSSNLQNPTLTGINTMSDGVYVVTATALGCSRSDTVLIQPVGITQTLRDTILCSNNPVSVKLSANIPNGGTALWSTGSTEPTITATEFGTYSVTVKYHGCEASANMNLGSKKCDCFIAVPNAFTPNNDGKNDFLKPVIPLECDIHNYSFAVYNRWGQQVFISHTPGEQWDGTWLGSPCEMGTYMYVVSCDFGVDKIHDLTKGDVSLLK